MEMKQAAATSNTDRENATTNRIFTAAKSGNFDELRDHLDADSSKINARNSNGLSPLHLAVKGGSLPCVKLLVSKNADVNMMARSSLVVTGPSEDAWTLAYSECALSPFLLACRLGHQSIVEFLFYNGADLRQTNADDDLNCLSLAIMYNREDTSKFLVTHTDFDTLLVLMKTKSHDLTLGLGRRAFKTSTPMRQLIQYMPDVAQIVMDRCITLNENGDEVKCYLELLDDYFSPWAQQNKYTNDVFDDEGNLLVNAQPNRTHIENDNTDVFDDEGKLCVDIEQNHTKIRNGHHPLALMQEQVRHVHLLTHPLSIKLIEHKWRVFGFALNLVSLLVYLIFLIFLTGYVLVNPPSFYFTFYNDTHVDWVYDPSKLLPDETYSEAAKYFFGSNSAGFLLTLVVLNVIKEIFQLYSQGQSYFNYQSLLEWSIYVLTFCLVIPVSEARYEEYVLRQKWQWQCGALAIFLAWINLTLYVRQTSSLGIYVIMFEDVLLSTVQFLAVILLFIVAFALAFNTLLLNQTDFHSFGDAFLRTFAMTTGELDFSRMFHSQNYLGTKNESPVEDYILTAVFSDIITSITFVVFVITMPIIAMNLLVGVAVEDIHRIRQKATFYYMKLKVDRVISGENMAFGTPLRKYVIRWLPITVQYLNMQLSRQSRAARFRSWFTSVFDFEKLRESVREVCLKNQERKELRAKSSPSSQDDQTDGGTDQTVLQKLRQMRDEINGMIGQIEHSTV
ncbi:transient receptor potential cation channel subfamily A member 1 homolog isoform X1 [Lytechinus variegatus]|uniref:transient receptor potential cation channel subfamily A member 1 homolog isoform X1 n=1 Tax=Lytechinus variegatus TaxID=7654 RepID=UPI001BB2A9EE|nr:transient receptor potential cation channel subfamily A member 1 homolog isoform X1 [Lytechinus variegatus]